MTPTGSAKRVVGRRVRRNDHRKRLDYTAARANARIPVPQKPDGEIGNVFGRPDGGIIRAQFAVRSSESGLVRGTVIFAPPARQKTGDWDS